MQIQIIESWRDISLRDLFFAYRKAKADCFFERSICIAQEFSEYETELPARLSGLLRRLHNDQIDDLLIENLGALSVVAKKLGVKPKPECAPDGHGFFSDPDRAFDRLCETHDLTPEFRLVGKFPVDMHVLSALWINLVGHKYDAVLSKNAYGSRLRRYRPEAGAPANAVGDYHLEAIGSFRPYFEPYKMWRGRGLNAIRRELENENAVIAVSMDLTSYYHCIDPSFLSNKAFLDDIGVVLTPWELSFTQSFTRALKAWSAYAANALMRHGSNVSATHGGIPIGLPLVSVVANVLLARLDRDIEQGLAPVYYGRYVDDIFLVLRDTGNIKNADDLLQFIANRTECFPKDRPNNGEIHLILPQSYRGETSLLLQQSKQKLFFLQGQGGLDLLASIESQIREVSSERRLMPSPDRLEQMASAKVLAAAGHAAEEADTLRRADGLAVRRLGWSVQLRAVETLARDLRQDDWREERERFYSFAHNHILRPDRILDHIDYLPRLLSLAVALMDWAQARRLVDGTFSAFYKLQQATSGCSIKLNGIEAKTSADEIWVGLFSSIRCAAADAIARSLRWSRRDGGLRSLPSIALNLCAELGLGDDPESLAALSLRLRESDWAKTPYKDHLRRDALRQRPVVDGEELLCDLYPHKDDLLQFLRLTTSAQGVSSATRVHPRCRSESDSDHRYSMIPYLFPTRPYSTQDVSLFLPLLCVFGADSARVARNWARYIRAVRGVWVWGRLFETESEIESEMPGDESPDAPLPAYLGIARPNQKVLLGISSLLTTDKSFEDAANNTPDLSRERYLRIETIVNHAISAHPRPTHLLLPELALPERWVDTVSWLLNDAGISLVAGLDYHLSGRNHIHSEAVLVLTDDRLGFPSTVQIRQPKSLPAPAEEKTLLKDFDKTWLETFSKLKKPVYVHKGFCFGILVCSELQNISYRRAFQGEVDCVMILSWNQDLDTFSALVESASLDVHAHIALVNNRRYGDSRVRSPAKENHARDTCRLRGGKNEHVVVVELDVHTLRAFQSRARRWPEEGDPYKPVPEGFHISKHRKTIPH